MFIESLRRTHPNHDQRHTQLASQYEMAAEDQAFKLALTGAVGRRALLEAAIVSQTEASLALTVPQSSARLATIADVTALGLTEIVFQTSTRLNRC